MARHTLAQRERHKPIANVPAKVKSTADCGFGHYGRWVLDEVQRIARAVGVGDRRKISTVAARAAVGDDRLPAGPRHESRVHEESRPRLGPGDARVAVMIVSQRPIGVVDDRAVEARRNGLPRLPVWRGNDGQGVDAASANVPLINETSLQFMLRMAGSFGKLDVRIATPAGSPR